MSSSTRLYQRLDRLPNDPSDPESVEDLAVCAFGAFERYYVCWKTRGGQYRQDGYDLPPELEEWLFGMADQRDFASLQVVFGRGNEFFASDKNGKLEYKEPEPEKKEPSPEELEEKRVLRRSRTISFMRPRSGEREKQSFLDNESAPSSRRSSLITGRPPSLAPSFRSASEGSVQSQSDSPPSSISEGALSSAPSGVPQPWSRPSSEQTANQPRPPSILDSKLNGGEARLDEAERLVALLPISASSQSTNRLRPLSMSSKSQDRAYPTNTGRKASSTSELPSLPLPSPLAAPKAPTKANPNPLSSSPPSTDVQLLRTQQKKVDQAPATRSIAPPFKLPEQRGPPISTSLPALSLEAVSTTGQTSPNCPVPASSTVQISNTSAETSPLSPLPPVPSSMTINSTVVETSPTSPIPAPVAKAPPLPTLSIQIVSTALETSPISPVLAPTADVAAPPSPQILSMHFSTLSTSPVDALPPPPATVPEPTQPPKASTSTPTQTSPPPSPLRTALRFNTAATRSRHTYSFSTASSSLDIDTPQEYFEPPPVLMGRMMDYYSKPGYQLGDSLFGEYRWNEPMIQEVESELSEWERANGRGY